MAEFFDGPHATPAPANDGPVYLGIKNITEDGHLDFSDVRHISWEDFPRWIRRVEPTSGDLVFTYEASLHRYAMIPPEFKGCLGRRTALIRPDPAVVDGRFLLYQFLGPQWRAEVTSRLNIGSTVDRVPLIEFPSFPIHLPPLGVQRRIAAVLAAYDELIENNLRRIAIVEELAQAVYREWFVNYRFPGHDNISLVESKLGLVPDGWDVVRLEDCSDKLVDGDWVETKDQGGEDYRLLQVSNVGASERRATSDSSRRRHTKCCGVPRSVSETS
jgi:type I restriction enzyme S subunit